MWMLLWAECRKLRRSNIVLLTMLATIFIAIIVWIGGMTTLSKEQLSTDLSGWYLNITQVWATLFILPAVITLLGSYMICREEQDDTMKILRLIPVNETKLTIAKMILTWIFSVLVYVLLFIMMLLIELGMQSDLSMHTIIKFFKMYLVDGICVFFAVSPWIALAPYLKKNYWISMLLTEIYSFAGIFMSMSNITKTFYPITAIFGISGYYETSTTNVIGSLMVLILCCVISVLLLKGLTRKKSGE